jgi:membrane-bound lytic murein transglycosylase B
MRGNVFRRFVLAVALVAGLPSTAPLVAPVSAQNAVTFGDFLAQLRALASSQGVSAATLDAVMPTLALNSHVVELDRAQPGGTPNGPPPKFAPYRWKHVDSSRISRGREKYQALRGFLGKVEAETGVPESIMISIYGNETNYGQITGNFDLLEAFAALAYDGRRRQLFTDEFIATLKLMDRGYPRSTLKGSWAGATGYPQFLPSMFLRLGKDGDGDGRADIWHSEADALASIANYFRNAGWRPGQVWGASVAVPAGFDRASIVAKMTSPRCPRVHQRHSVWKTVAEWRAMGLVPTGAGLRDGDLASFFEPDGPGTPAWLLTANYRVILDYNCSNFYALSVGLLADAVKS